MSKSKQAKRILTGLSVSDLLGYTNIFGSIRKEIIELLVDLQKLPLEMAFSKEELANITIRSVSLNKLSHSIYNLLMDLRLELDRRVKRDLALDFIPSDIDKLFNEIQNEVKGYMSKVSEPSVNQVPKSNIRKV